MSAPFAPPRVTVVVTPTTGLRDAASRVRVLGAAAGVLGMEAGALRLGHGADGRPHLAGPGAGAHVSLSHGRGMAAFAFTGLGPVGVDVEVERPVPALRMADRWFSETEAAWLRDRPEEQRVSAFFWLWTHKEAMGKAYGTGLAGGGLTRTAPIPAEWPSRRRREPRMVSVPGRSTVTVAAPEVPAGVMLAVSVLGSDARGAPVEVHLRSPRGTDPRTR